MKKRYLFIAVPAAVLLIGMALLFYGGRPLQVPELSASEKMADFEYLAKLVREVYPFSEALQQDKGLESFDSLNKRFIEEAGKTADNAAFLKLVYEYMTFLGQAGHAQIVYDELYSPYLSFFYKIDKKAYRSSVYWQDVASRIRLYVHSDADIRYENGRYVLDRDYKLYSAVYPAGSVIMKVNGLPVDDYVRSLQTGTHLAVDAQLSKLFTHQLLTVDPGPEGWSVELVRPDGTTQTGRFPAMDGYKPPYPLEGPQDNVIVRELDSQTGYIRVFSFLSLFKDQDFRTIQDFMKSSGGRYKKLIVDVRRNGGGEDDYWADNLVKPLLKEPAAFERTSSVRNSFLDRYGIRFKLYKKWVGSTLTDKERYGVAHVEKLESSGPDQEKWSAYRVRKELKPENSFPFDGRLYVLADSETFSAADNFVETVQALKLGTVAGTNTAGGASVYMEPYRYALPNSGIIFKLETDLNRNKEGQINEIHGTMPDVWLESSRFPNAYPQGYGREELLRDKWIGWAMSQK